MSAILEAPRGAAQNLLPVPQPAKFPDYIAAITYHQTSTTVAASAIDPRQVTIIIAEAQPIASRK